MTHYEDGRTDEEVLVQFYENFCLVASIQSRIAYTLMSIHAVNPCLWRTISSYDPHKILFYNMVYGTSILIFSRPFLRNVKLSYRISFGVLGSLAFNHSSILLYEWLVRKLSHKPVFLTFCGIICGRVMMAHFLAFFYYCDVQFRAANNQSTGDEV